MKWLGTTIYLSVFICIFIFICGVESGLFTARKEKEKNDEGKRHSKHRARVADLYEDEDYYYDDEYGEDDIFESLERQAAAAYYTDELDEPLPFSKEEREEFEEMMQMIDNVDWGEGSVDEISALMDGLGLDFTDEEIESLASIVKDEELAHSSDMLGEFREVISELQRDGETLTEAQVMEVIETMGGNLKVSRAEIDSIVNTNSTKKCPASFGHDRLLKAVQENDYFIVQCIIKVHQEIRFDLDAIDGDGTTALMWAAFSGDRKIVDILLETKNVELDMTDGIGLTSLMYACTQGHESIVNKLLDYKADVNIKDDEGNTALIWAARMGYDEIVGMLVNACADIDVKNAKQESAASEGKDYKKVVKAMNNVPKHCQMKRSKHSIIEGDRNNNDHDGF